ncbi:MAG: thiamine phosphate synthase [Herpetosiphon sp.]
MTLPAPLLVITDRRTTPRSLHHTVAAALTGGCRWLLVREKDLPLDEYTHLVRSLLDLAVPYGATIGVHAHANIAARLNVPSLHLPSGASIAAARAVVGPAVVIGASTHSLESAHAAIIAGADYITLSPIFPTRSKPGYGPPLGPAFLARSAAALASPIVALGGITSLNIAACRGAGAAACAVMGEVMRASDPASVVQDLLSAWYAAPQPKSDPHPHP